VIDTALRQHFNISFAELETAYLASLRAQPFTDAERTDLRLTVEFFNTVRRYQKALDPSAYFLTAWLPDGSLMRQRGIVADFLRRPKRLDNRLLESLFVRAWQELIGGDYTGAERTLKWSNWILDILST
jgi:deoxyribodipyrimidine photolyase